MDSNQSLENVAVLNLLRENFVIHYNSNIFEILVYAVVHKDI